MTTKRLAAIALLCLTSGLAQPAPAPAACASLCGEWRLDAAASDDPGKLLDAALLQYKEPKVRHPSRVLSDNIEALGKAADEEALGPILDRPRSKELRDELQRALQQPRVLKFSGDADDIRIAGDDNSVASFSPGESHSRVDVFGTARISAGWRGAQLAINEKYDHSNQQETTYKLDSDGALRVQQVVARRGLPRVTVRSLYRRP